MRKFKMHSVVLVGSIVMLALLADFSIIGAFAGPRASKAFFNSVPLLAFWGVLCLLLAAGFFVWPSLRRRSSLLCIHAGLMLVLAGGLLGSERGHVILNRFTEERLQQAFIELHEGEIASTAALASRQLKKLPFDVHLKRAVIEYYPGSPMVSDYKSDLAIIRNGATVKEAQIEVNKPLYYGGYHFYQNTFGFDQGVPVSGIMIVSSRGIVLVFAGYALIAGGVFVHFWRVLFSGRRTEEGSA